MQEYQVYCHCCSCCCCWVMIRKGPAFNHLWNTRINWDWELRLGSRLGFRFHLLRKLRWNVEPSLFVQGYLELCSHLCLLSLEMPFHPQTNWQRTDNKPQVSEVERSGEWERGGIGEGAGILLTYANRGQGGNPPADARNKPEKEENVVRSAAWEACYRNQKLEREALT